MLNISREIFGLLGITILGAILSARQTSLVADGAKPLTAFLEAYQSTLVIAAAIVLVGVPLSLFALRTPRPADPETTAAERPAVPWRSPDPMGTHLVRDERCLSGRWTIHPDQLIRRAGMMEGVPPTSPTPPRSAPLWTPS